MRIALISYWTCPLERLGVLAAGGMNVYVYNLAVNLGNLGVKVDIYTRRHRSRHRRVFDLHKNVRIIHLDERGGSDNDRLDDFSERLLENISGGKMAYDLIHAHYYLSGLIAIKLKHKLKIPLVTTFHTLSLVKEKYSGIVNPERIKIEKNILVSSDAIIASTEIEKFDLEVNYDAPKDKIFVVAPGVNHRVFKPYNKVLSRKKLGLPISKKIILFVGRIDPVKGLEFLIGAIYQLSMEVPAFMNNFRVLLIGGDINSRTFWQNPEVIKIKNLIYEKEIDCCIKFLGSKPHNILPYYYSASDVVVMPSVYESFGLVILEAMASGAAVLASKVGGMEFLIRDGFNGKHFIMGDQKSLEDNLLYILKSNTFRKTIGKNAGKTSQEFCWDKQARKIIEVYNKFL